MNRHRWPGPLLPLIALALVLATGCFPKRFNYLTPAKFETVAAAGELRPLTLRVYADAEYRAQLAWRERLDSLVLRANAVIARFGVQFVIAEVVPWDRKAELHGLQEMLDELQQLEPSPKVDFVVGLSAALPYATSNMEILGRATLLKPYWVSRGFDLRAEAEALAKAVKDENKLSSLARERTRHLELVVFLHEWAHTVGVPHMRESHSVMSPRCWAKQDRFGPESERMIEISLRHLLRRSRHSREHFGELLQFVESNPDGDWDWEGRDQLARYLGGRPRLPPGQAQTGETPGAAGEETQAGEAEAAIPTKEQVASRLERARAHLGSGRLDEAWSAVEPLLAVAPEDRELAELSCEIAARRPWTEAGFRACRQATVLAPQSAAAWLALGDAAATGANVEEAKRAALEARALLERENAAEPGRWLMLARLARRLDLVSLAELSAARAGTEGEEILAWGRATRRRLALPRSAAKRGVSEEQEPEYVALMKRGTEALLSARIEAIGPAADEAERRFPFSPGARLLKCALAAERGKAALARILCGEALKLDGEASLAHFELGLCAMRELKLSAAQTSLRRTVDLSPEVRQAWKSLAVILDARGMKKERADLGQQYRAVHGGAL